MMASSVSSGKSRSVGSNRNRSTKRLGQVLVLIGTFALLIAGPLQPYVAAIQTPQGFYIPDNHYQFSPQEVMRNTKTLSHTFTLYNGRPQPLHIKASADCGCTGLSWTSATIAPFRSKSIVASMNKVNLSSTVGLNFKSDKDKYAFASLKQEHYEN